MIALAPEYGIRDQEISNFMAAIIENERAPILMCSFPGVFMLVQGGAIKLGQTPFISREMSGNPIDNHTNTRFMHAIDKELKIFGRAVSGGRSKKPGDLVSPRRIKCVFGDG